MQKVMFIDEAVCCDRRIDEIISAIEKTVSHKKSYIMINNAIFLPSCIILVEICFISLMIGIDLCVLLISIATVFSLTLLASIKVIDQNKDATILTVSKFTKIIAKCSRGLKIYEAYDFVKTKLAESIVNYQEEQNNQASKHNYLKILIMHIAMVIVFSLPQLVLPDIYNRIKSNIALIVSGVFFLSITVLSGFFRNLNNEHFDFNKYISDKMIDSDDEDCEYTEIQNDIGINFNDVTLLKSGSIAKIVSHLSMTICSGDFVIITGQESDRASDIYDLIFKNKRAHDGSIYIGGTNINYLSSSSIVNKIGYFDETSCLMFGTILDNIAISTKDYEMVSMAALKAGIDTSDLYSPIYDQHNNILINQELRLRIQIARIILHKYSALLINSPNTFETKENEVMFYNFIRSAMGKKTIIMRTMNLNFVLYSSKVLYLGNKICQFGCHMDLINNREYRTFIGSFAPDILSTTDKNIFDNHEDVSNNYDTNS